MNRGMVAGLMAALFAGVWQAVPPAPSAAPANSERVERGTVPGPGGVAESYQIRLLPVDSFPELPPEMASELKRRGCMIPQSFEAQQPENVIEGAFRAPGSSDWAALCSVNGVTTLYVFFAGQADAPIGLRSQPDTAWLGAEPGSDIFGSAWGINVRTAEDLSESRQLRGEARFDHDGIEDAHLEHAATVHYWQSGQWLVLKDRN